MTREEKIYLAYKSAVAARRRKKDLNAQLMAIVDTSHKLKISVFLVLSIVKARDKK